MTPTPDLTELDRLHAEFKENYQIVNRGRDREAVDAAIRRMQAIDDIIRNAYPALAARIRALEAKVAAADRLGEKAESIKALVDCVESRTMATDGPVPTLWQEMTKKEYVTLDARLGNLVKALAEYRTPPAKESSDARTSK